MSHSLSQATVAAFCWAVIIVGPSPVQAAEPSAAAIEFFEKRIRPVLATHCYECHSAEAAARNKLKGGLAVDTRAGLLQGGESGPAVVPGSPDESLLLKAVRHDSDASEMPPSEKLPAGVIADFTEWIRNGAADPRAGAAATAKRGLSIAEGREFWSFQPPRAAAIPTAPLAGWPRSPIDAFISVEQAKHGLAPLPDAPPHLLLRRLHFDLIGLPPTPAQLDEFLQRWHGAPTTATSGDSLDVARETLLAETVDSLLASPHFGERWGRHWLDAARYADSNGRDRNMYFYHAWRYRDYVIDAFNKDKPFDRFVREQVAGDLLPFDSREQHDEQRIATGFLALGGKAFEELNPQVFQMDLIDDQIEVVGRAVLGLSIGCARCHDHKFDPIPTADYYALAGIFRSTETLYGFGPKGIKSNEHTQSTFQAVGPEAESLAPAGLEYFKSLQALTFAQNDARIKRYGVVRKVSAKKIELQKPDADKAALEAEIAAMEAEIKDWNGKVKVAEQALQTAMDSAPPQPGWAMGVRERSTPEDCRIHIRGDVKSLGDSTPRGVLQVVFNEPISPIPAERSGRRELADWLTRPDNPLTARVFVNRVWMHLFGRGIVSTPDDFGVNGARPSHPELLDHLALHFVNDGWSIKRLIRSIVLSRSYRVASHAGDEHAALFAQQQEIDADDVYLWRMKPRRLEAEIIRDAITSVAGTLDHARPSPDQAFLARFNPAREDEYRPFQPLFAPADVQHAYRGVYLPVVRGVLPEMFQLFDFASPDRSVSQRDESVVPAQSLYFMNSAWVISQATAAAQKLLQESHAVEKSRIVSLYRRAYSREPTPQEISRSLRYLEAASGAIASEKQPTPSLAQVREERWTSLCQIVFASAEFLYVR